MATQQEADVADSGTNPPATSEAVAHTEQDGKAPVGPGKTNQDAPAQSQPEAKANGQIEPEACGDQKPPEAHGGKDQQDGKSDKPRPPRKTTTELKEVKEKVLDSKQKIKDKTHPPGGWKDAPFPDAPPGYTLKFTFHKATNLPAADLATASSDPFLLATLRTALPKRDKEDPDLSHRTRTVQKKTDPEWNEEWIVANVPSSGFTLKCRIYDEDSADHDDRLGNVTLKVEHVDEKWKGIPAPGQEFQVKKRMGSKRAYFFKGIVSALSKEVDMTPSLFISVEVLGKSDPPHGQIYTVGPTTFMKHFSPMIGRIAGTKVNKDEEHDVGTENNEENAPKKYDFQANEMQLSGPVPAELYHRYVEFRPIIGSMFNSHGVRGKVLHFALQKQHKKVYNFNASTVYGQFKACSEEASMQFLKMAHFDEGGRIFTYVLTLDSAFRFTETGKEFGIDLLSKHTMHSDVATFIACSGEFFIRRLQHPDASDDPEPNEATHPEKPIKGGPPEDAPPNDPSYYQLIIDNDSGTYRPDKRVLPKLKEFLERNFPGLGVIAMHWEDEELKKLKDAQLETKRKEGKGVNMVMNRSPSSSSLSSNESDLAHMEGAEGEARYPTKKERLLDVVEQPKKLKHVVKNGMDGDTAN